MHQQVVPGFSFHQSQRVMHPGIIAACVATADQAKWKQRLGAGEAATKRLQLVQHCLRRGFNHAARRLETCQQGRPQRAEVEPMRGGFQVGQRQPAATTRQSRGDHGFRRRQRLPWLATGFGIRSAEAVDDFPVGALIVAAFAQRNIDARDAANREGIENEVVMVLGQRRNRRQDQVGMARGFVDVKVDRDHEVQCFDRGIEIAPVGRRKHGVAGNGQQRADLAFARCLHFFGQHRHGQFAGELRQAADAALPSPAMAAAGARARDRDGRFIQQRAALAVEVSGVQVGELQQPLA